MMSTIDTPEGNVDLNVDKEKKGHIRYIPFLLFRYSKQRAVLQSLLTQSPSSSPCVSSSTSSLILGFLARTQERQTSAVQCEAFVGEWQEGLSLGKDTEDYLVPKTTPTHTINHY